MSGDIHIVSGDVREKTVKGDVRNSLFQRFTRLLFYTVTGKITLIAFLTLGCTSGLLISLIAMGIMHIPIVWFIAQIILNSISLFAIIVFIFGFVFHIKLARGEDIYEFSDKMINKQKTLVRIYNISSILSKIQWDSLKLGELGKNMGACVNNLRAACEKHESDKENFSSIYAGIFASVFQFDSKRAPILMGQLSRIAQFCSKECEKKNDEANKQALKDMCVALEVLTNYFNGLYEKEILDPVIHGISDAVLRFENSSSFGDSSQEIQEFLRKKIHKTIAEKRADGQLFPFDFSRHVEKKDACKKLCAINKCTKKNPCIITNASLHIYLMKHFNCNDVTIACYSKNTMYEVLSMDIIPKLQNLVRKFLIKQNISENAFLIDHLHSLTNSKGALVVWIANFASKIPKITFGKLLKENFNREAIYPIKQFPAIYFGKSKEEQSYEVQVKVEANQKSLFDPEGNSGQAEEMRSYSFSERQLLVHISQYGISDPPQPHKIQVPVIVAKDTKNDCWICISRINETDRRQISSHDWVRFNERDNPVDVAKRLLKTLNDRAIADEKNGD
jgi:hypothetical protein